MLTKAKNIKAFTIVELLIVIFIIAILAALAIVAYSGITDKAKVSSLQADLSSSAKQLKLYYSNYASYPTGLDSNGCPALPTADTNFCIKRSSGNTLSSYVGTATTFTLSLQNGTKLWKITESTAPQSATAFTLTLNSGPNGSVSGAGMYETGSVVTISATPDSYYAFSSWTGDTGCSGSQSHTLTITANTTCSASFSASNPGAPGSLSGSVANINQVNLSWSVSGGVVSGYKIYRSTSPAPTTLITTTGNVTSYTDSNLSPNTTYYYRITSTGTGGDSTSSNEISVLTDKADGSSSALASASGYQLKQDYPSKTTGWYWIKSASMPTARQMYVDMTQDGGGYDFYAISGGTAVSYSTETHSGTAMGLDLLYPRSQGHFKATYDFISSQLGGAYSSYMQIVGKVTTNTRTVPTGVYGSGCNMNGNYTSYIMRNPTYYGSGAPDFRVPDNGKWWLRNSTFGEPNGDLCANGFLGLYAAGYALNSDGSLTGFNDGGAYSTGSSYIVSTNAKP